MAVAEEVVIVACLRDCVRPQTSIFQINDYVTAIVRNIYLMKEGFFKSVRNFFNSKPPPLPEKIERPRVVSFGNEERKAEEAE